jgi:hypothetical protein
MGALSGIEKESRGFLNAGALEKLLIFWKFTPVTQEECKNPKHLLKIDLLILWLRGNRESRVSATKDS